MLVIKCEDYLDAVVEFAEKRGIVKDLFEKLDWLGNFGRSKDPTDVKCELFKDFAPYSFTWRLYRKNKTGIIHKYGPCFYNGGLIYYGSGETGVATPQFSVRLHGLEEGWEINS